MPLILIEIVGPPPAVEAAPLAQSLADALGLTLGTPPGATWVRVRRTDAPDYAEQGVSVEDIAREGWPVFVEVLLARPGTPDEMTATMQRTTQAVAQVLQRPPARVHVMFAPAGAGRVAFGGHWVGASARHGESSET